MKWSPLISIGILSSLLIGVSPRVNEMERYVASNVDRLNDEVIFQKPDSSYVVYNQHREDDPFLKLADGDTVVVREYVSKTLAGVLVEAIVKERVKSLEIRHGIEYLIME